MAQGITFRCRAPDKGFSLLELSIAFVVLGVLAAFGVPRMMQSVERSKASESFQYLGWIRMAQERHRIEHGSYTPDLSDLNLQAELPQYFSVGPITAGETGQLADSWRLTLTRTGRVIGYQNYTVTFDEHGFQRSSSTIEDDVNPHSS